MIIDCNANLGNWPFRRMNSNTPDALIERLARIGVGRAWVTLFDAVMLNDVGSANRWLAEIVAGYDALVPVGSVNPAWPAWERDIAECADLGFEGVRVNANYHGWRLADPVRRELLAALAEHGLFLEVTVRMCDERCHHRLAMVPPTPLEALAEAAGESADVPILVVNANGQEARRVASDAGGELPANLYFEISHLEGLGGVRATAEQVGVEHLVFGTHAPYFYPESSQLKVSEECDFSVEEVDAITHGNADRLLAGRSGR